MSVLNAYYNPTANVRHILPEYGTSPNGFRSHWAKRCITISGPGGMPNMDGPSMRFVGNMGSPP
jgi:hypothetical protein